MKDLEKKQGEQVKEFMLRFCPSIEDGSPEFIREFNTLSEVNMAAELIAAYTIFLQDKAMLMQQRCNYFVVEQFVDGDWRWFDE